eukprot:TRINITY_DN9397_c0_g3_i1.p1 TRINITY_DN9397_c0_g3~~TRINITY_DN9397_c0_g3_i1.p1  ORF type:complete len:531 (+),score=113.40 TRINITY_DN9397_c0_g3_i1:58-1650(+)
MQRLLISVLLGAAAGQTCTDAKKDGHECKGDAYKVVQETESADACCAICARDYQCNQWSFKPSFLFFSSTCTLSKTKSSPSAKMRSTCGQKTKPTPPPPPAPPPAPGAEHHWAVIMAGSNSYMNYRHQADACHAYQLAKKNGIPESQIIMLAYDDIADSRENPFPGQVFNKPNGTDVYAGCKIDYRGKDVNRANFLKVLQGDASAPGPVLKSTAQDHVFVYFADHGGVGILGVPDGAPGGYIHAKDVNDALESMHSKGMYKELLFYVEACESGSIFKGLLKAPNVYAITAANAAESSWGFYCPPQDVVSGKSIGSCLGDEFSIRWMEDSDVADFKKETVMQQVQKVTSLVKKSHVSQFGDSNSIGRESIGEFEGGQPLLKSTGDAAVPPSHGDYSNSAVDSRDVEVHVAYYRMHNAKTLEEKRAAQAALTALLAKRTAADEKFMRIAMAAVGDDKAKAQAMIDGDLHHLENVDCHVRSLEAVVDHCGPITDYTMRYSRLFANLCSALPVGKVESAVKQVCSDGAKTDLVI